MELILKMDVKGKKKRFYHEQNTQWGKRNSAAKSGSNLVMKGTEKVDVPNTLGIDFTSKGCYQVYLVSASSSKV